MSLLAVDIGTSGVRAGAFTAAGEPLVEVSRATTLWRPRPGIVETDAEQCLADTVALLAEVATHPAVVADPPTGLSFSLQGEACVPVDAAGRALAPAPVSMDRRGVDVLARVVEEVGADELQRITGQPVHPMFSVHKIAAEGVLWRGTDVVGYRCLGDFVAARLGARPAMDATIAARTGAYDVEARAWSEVVLGAVGLPADLFPEVVDPGTVIGALDAGAASATGLPAGLPVVVGSHDQASSFWGGGGRPGASSVFALGSSDCLTVGSTARPEGLGGTGIATYPGADGGWLTLAGTAAGGWALEWFGTLVGASTPEARAALLDAVGPDPSPVLVLPYVAGSGTLDNDLSATGAVIGLTLTTTREDVARGFLESTGYELRKIVTAFEARGLPVGDVLAVGGGAASSASLGIRADAYGRPLSTGRSAGSLRGAAMQAAVGTGLHPSLSDLPAPEVRHVGRPDPARAEWYAAQGARYDALYRALVPLTTPTHHPTKESS